MRKLFVIASLVSIVLSSLSFSKESLRSIYSRPSSEWPKPSVDEGVYWKELGILPSSPLDLQNDSIKNLVELGKILFFDTRLSNSGKISCATCHQPELSWTDGKEKSIGHEGAMNKRNSPSLQNVWFFQKLFWDGRAKDLQDQAFAPINSESEMHSDMPDVMRKIRSVKEYSNLFKKAFGDDAIDPDRMTEAIASFEKTIVSRKSRFDDFLEGNKKALTNSELRGLNLFRTKARCMNCHNGSLFSDNQFHNTGLTHGDDGYYKVTHKDEDKGKFKTPSLRDVVKTGPWMHDGSFTDLSQVISRYNIAKAPPGSSDLIRSIGLTNKEMKDLLAFLKAISAEPLVFGKPSIP